jgi:hypothetical protein
VFLSNFSVSKIKVTDEIHIARAQNHRKEWDRTISLKLTKDSIKRNYIYIPSRYRNLFPPYKKEFSLETDAGKLSVYITSEKKPGVWFEGERRI